MATITRENFKPSKTHSIGEFPIIFYPEATSQSVLSGDNIYQICQLNSGRIRKVNATAPRASLAANITTILGVTSDPFTNRTATSNTKSTFRGVYLAHPMACFRSHVSAGFASQSLTAAQLGTSYGLINLSSGGGSGIWVHNFSMTSANSAYVKVVEHIDDIADVNGASNVTFENDKIVFGGD